MVSRTRWCRRTATSIRLAPGEPKKIDEVRVGRLVLDGDVILPADGATVNERRKMGYGGLITVALPVGEDGRLAGKPLIRPFGVPVEEDRDDFIADATDAATRAFAPGADEERLREAVRLAVRRCATLVDRQEAAGRGDAPASRGMNLTSIVAIYFLFFAGSAFIPSRSASGRPRRSVAGLVPGQAESAPHRFDLRRHFRAAIIAAVLFGLYYANWGYGWVTADDLDFYNPLKGSSAASRSPG